MFARNIEFSKIGEKTPTCHVKFTKNCAYTHVEIEQWYSYFYYSTKARSEASGKKDRELVKRLLFIVLVIGRWLLSTGTLATYLPICALRIVISTQKKRQP